MKGEYKFFMKVIKSVNNCVIVGIVDKEKQKNHRYSWFSGNAICYNGEDGSISYGTKNGEYKGIQRGKGFKEGDEVSVEVFFEKGKIKWCVNGKEVAFVDSPLLKRRNFVPYIELFNKGDKVIAW